MRYNPCQSTGLTNVYRERKVSLFWTSLESRLTRYRCSDFLSSIEILVIDQMNAMLMQNWDHVQVLRLSLTFAMASRSHILITVHSFAHEWTAERIAWYGLFSGKAMVSWWTVCAPLDHLYLMTTPLSSIYLRQSIFLSPFDTPDIRSLYNSTLKNVAGKVRVEKSWPALQVPASIDQVRRLLGLEIILCTSNRFSGSFLFHLTVSTPRRKLISVLTISLPRWVC